MAPLERSVPVSTFKLAFVHELSPFESFSNTLLPVGWTFQSGLPGTAGGRLYGFGVNQVLMLEMVLLNGDHIKFGPTERETAKGYDVPKTVKVSGICHSNPYKMGEDKWEWEACPDDESWNFDDLWFAVRAGGVGLGAL